MGKNKKTRKIVTQRFAQMKKMISPTDARIKNAVQKPKKPDPTETIVKQVTQQSSALFFQYNTQLGPPYHILIDTNFVNFSIKNKLDIIENMMECLYAKCIPYITDCVLAELEKLGKKYKIALKIIKDSRFERLHCMHKGTYADDCIVNRVTQHKCYIVATNDKDLKRRIRKIPGVPIMYVAQHRYTIERMPDAYGALKSCSVACSKSQSNDDNATLALCSSIPMSVNLLILSLSSGILAGPPAYADVQCLAVWRNKSGCSLNCLATTASCGSSGSAADNKAWRESNTVRRVIAAAHWSLRISRQIAPVTEDIFGCHILVINLTFGGLNGYVSGTLISRTKLPPSYGVSGGPAISPLSSVKLSFTNSTRIAHLATSSDFITSLNSRLIRWAAILAMI